MESVSDVSYVFCDQQFVLKFLKRYYKVSHK